ncbi:uncharacterized protein [Haliotis asinina]|uniref:uncharacterized protein isoform X1 n=1 Tax=Haliotis asinina TaxID=109174 RepID=UPI0035320BFD
MQLFQSSYSPPTVCRFYWTPGGCWYGERCRYSHIENTLQDTESRPYCSYFMSGNCRFGTSCFNRHGPLDYQMKTQDLSDLDTSSSNPTTSESDQSMLSNTTPSTDVTEASSDFSLLDADLSRSSEECVKPRRKPKDITCGQCNVYYEGSDAYDNLKEHYLENLRRMDGRHTSFLAKGIFRRFAVCTECDRHFKNAHAFLQHIVAKAKVTGSAQKEHANDLDCVAQMFVDRDAGNDTEKDFTQFMCDYLTAEGADSTEGEVDLEDEDMKYLGRELSLMNPFDIDECEDSDDNYGVLGFDEDEVYELLCQGIKPWDPEAGAALAVLSGYDDFY